ncbi:hypothetical protein DH86_00001372, partial [Scytalidium sp. 3C]
GWRLSEKLASFLIDNPEIDLGRGRKTATSLSPSFINYTNLENRSRWHAAQRDVTATARIRLQTGMRGAWGKPQGTVARVNIGQIILSVRTRDSNRAIALEALRRSQYKFPGRQKIIVSKNWGFTPLRREEYLEKKEAGKVLVDGAYVQFLRSKGDLESNMKRFPAAFAA